MFNPRRFIMEEEMRKALIPTKLNSIAKTMLEEAGYTVIQDADAGIDALVSRHADGEALIVRSEKVTAEIIDKLPKLKVVVRAGSGYNTIDTKYARKKGVDVMNTPGANANAVAEEVVALILAHYRHVVRGDNTTREGLWEKKALMGRELTGKTVGIVGLGNIGQLVIKLLKGFDCEVLGYDPVISSEKAASLGVELLSLKDVFARADIISLHVPQTDETKGMVNSELLGAMKDGAVLVNCARAAVVDEDAMRQVKAEKNIGFCNDVYPEDKAGKKSVADIADVMLPHLGASTIEANTNAARRAAEQLMAYFERGVTRYVVNKSVPDELDEAYQQLAFEISCVARRYLGMDKAVKQIRATYYGDLTPYGKWFLSPIVAGISSEFDALEDPENADGYLQEKGIEYVERPADDSKEYGNSMTIDLEAGDERTMSRVSVRGTIVEGRCMISRINDFDNLYFPAIGNSLIVVYEDRPGVLAKITGAMADLDVNIDYIRSALDSAGKNSVAVLKTNRLVPADSVAKLSDAISAKVAFATSL
jgi:D-3-phosphoglycerate dehydrogenase